MKLVSIQNAKVEKNAGGNFVITPQNILFPVKFD
jgi:hypothetical protein